MGIGSSIENEFNKYNYNNNLETFSLLWLDAQVDQTEENRQAQKKLRNIINHFKIFDNENECQQYILSISSQDRVILIVSGRLGRTIVPRIHHLRQIISIYVYCMDKQTNEQWSINFTKVKAVVIQLNDLISQITQDQKTRIKIDEPLSFNIYSLHNNIDQSTTSLNGHFVHSLLLIDVLLRMKIKQTDKKELISLCYNEYKDNPNQLNMVRKFEKKYSSHKALLWYSCESFLYKILNKALRTQNIDIMYLFRFIINDIYRQLKENQCQQSVRVYRGQVMSIDEINNLRESINNFISINSFFSTSINREKAIEFLYRTKISDNLHRVLFEIDANPYPISSKPFADISKYSIHSDEKEILFMIGCVFRLINVHQSDNHEMWIIQMKLSSDDEHDLKKLFEHMKRDYGGGNDTVDILAFGRVLCQMGKYDLAEKFYRRLLHEISSNDPCLSDLYYSLGVVIMDTGDYESSLESFYKSLNIIIRRNPLDYINISSRYCCIGLLHWKKKYYTDALACYRKGIELFEKINNRDHLSLAHFYNNIALVYSDQNKYIEALENYNKALTIYEKHLPSDHPDIGTAHDNIGIIHRFLGHYDLAKKYHIQSLQIRQKSLPNHHPLIALNYKNLGLVYENTGHLNDALTYLRKAGTIYRQSLSFQHPDIQTIEHDIQRVFIKLS